MQMTAQGGRLRDRLNTFLHQDNQDIGFEACLILKNMLENGELTCRVDSEQGIVCNWWSAQSDRLLDRVAAIEDEVQQAVLELFLSRYLEFTADPFVHDVDIVWRLRPEHRRTQ